MADARQRAATARSRRVLAELLLDAVVLTGALLLAYELRFDFDVPPARVEAAAIQLPLVVAIQLCALALVRVHAFPWGHVGLVEASAFARAGALAAAPMIALRLWLPVELAALRAPLSVILIDALLAFGGVLGVRVLVRAALERRRRRAAASEGASARVLLIGAGRAGALAVREMTVRRGLVPVGFVDDDPRKRGQLIHGVKVLGATTELAQVVRATAAQRAVITVASAVGADIRRIVGLCEAIALPVRIIPSLYELLLGNLEAHARNIEIEDLLGRNQVDIDRAPLESFLAGKVVMVTGAGGSIGTEICRQVAQFAPSRLVLVERSEFALFTIERELSQRSPEVEAVAALVDVRDRARLARLYDQHQPAVVIHAAAHKHVPMLEANACEAVINNVVGTKNAAELARDRGVAVFVLVSTDKAVRPTSLMGATKRVAELAVQAVGGATQVVTVRFGNVLGSTGSVVPIFRDQIRRGGPVTVTHPEMERYFMTIAEASQLVLQAGAMGEGGATYILDMGEPVRIVELARDMIRLSGLRVDVDVGIAFTGVRPGEKLREELRYEAETVAPTRHPKILRTRSPRMLDTWVSSYVDELISHARTGDDAAVRRHLARLPGAAITTRREEAHDERPRQRA